MKKVGIITLIAMLFTFSGCGRIDRDLASITGAPSEVCYDNVVYLKFTSGVTPKLTQDGMIATCK